MHSKANPSTKLYTRKVPILWWTKRWVDIRFISRELTSLFVAGYSVILLFYVRSISQGPEAYAAFCAMLTSPLFIFLHAFAIIALIYHSITWFNLAPKAMVIKVGDKQVPGLLIAAGNYAGWILVSVAIVLIVINL